MKTGSDELSTLISATLRTGIVLALACGLLGFALYVPTAWVTPVSFKIYAGPHVPYASLAAIVQTALHGATMAARGAAIAEIGILLLMLTPIARVVLSLVAFLRQGDRLFAGMTVLILMTLAASILIH